MRNSSLLLLLALLTACETAQQPAISTANQAATPKQPTNSIPKQTPTGIVFNTSDVLYTGGLGEAGVDGFCKRIGTQVVQKFGELGINAVSNAAPNPEQAKITITLSTIESKTGVGFDFMFGARGAQKLRARYAAQLDSPGGATLATWKHEVEEESVDKLTDHIASDIVKYLKKGFK
jgi:hypothetical protein